ncbi:hypothetical protein THAOC_23542 [Thalassiosira oceanica]|uniref:Uncharacterized protein n=1 Tax=Thalassiosira oceanica TaxID=159749 RepID=K0SD09_THAOC|nr:hypothetical protein THAOC_23542 [Thalassiosira oceanica]|eukprot:EJK56552.1 hypothetical protein THAOC_23542 [Thalassiosira oceanica]
MEVPRKKAKTCPGDDTKDGGAEETRTAARQIAELQGELERCRREKAAALSEKNAAELRHERVVEDLKGSYSDALEWAYSVKPIPREHWLEKEYNEEYADAMDEFQDTFKQTIKDLRTGTAGERIEVKVVSRLQDEEDLDVSADHDDVLMPYWKEFANAIVHWSEYHAGEATLQVIIRLIETPDAVLDVLCPAIKRSKVRAFGFTGDGSPKTWRFAKFIGDIIRSNHRVTSLGFGSVTLSNEEWKTICNAIRMRHSQASIMRGFQLTNCFVGGISTELLRDVLTSQALGVDLGWNGMSSNESSIIAEFLASNPPLASLLLKGNRFNDADSTLLANSLSSNTTLKRISVDKNNINQEGRLAFLRAIFDVSSLDACSASNHTCIIRGLGQDILCLNCYDEPCDNKWEKIFAMLSLSGQDLCINTALLGEVPASLMPVLLYRANDQDEFETGITDLYLELTDNKRCKKHDVWDGLGNKKALSCVYDLMRSWVVPSIYV